jgi:hypothetical protein
MAIDTAQQRENAASGYAAAATHASLHTADPSGTGANEVVGGSPAYTRVAITWSADAVDGVYTATLANPFDVPASTTVTHMGLWTAASGGTYLDKAACQVTFASQGQLTIPSITYTQS